MGLSGPQNRQAHLLHSVKRYRIYSHISRPTYKLIRIPAAENLAKISDSHINLHPSRRQTRRQTVHPLVQHSHCAQSLCTVIVHSHCAQSLCTVTFVICEIAAVFVICIATDSLCMALPE